MQQDPVAVHLVLVQTVRLPQLWELHRPGRLAALQRVSRLRLQVCDLLLPSGWKAPAG